MPGDSMMKQAAAIDSNRVPSRRGPATLFWKSILLLLLTVWAGVPLTKPAESPPALQASAPTPPPSAPAKKSAAELEKLAMPIALHPDPLIAVLLPASVYPVEVVIAARFVKDTNNLAKLDSQPWDDSVKALAKFPELLTK